MTTLLEAAKQAEKVLAGWEDEDGQEKQALMLLREAIQIEEDATVKPRTGKRRIISMSESAYATVIETLTYDSQSSFFDSGLKNQIKLALRSIREEKPAVRIEVNRGIAEVAKAPAWVEVRIVDHDNH